MPKKTVLSGICKHDNLHQHCTGQFIEQRQGLWEACLCPCHRSKEEKAVALLESFVRECKGPIEKGEEMPGADAVDYLVSLYESAKAIVALKKKKGKA